VYLNCKTYFSFRYGTFSTEGLVEAGMEAGASVLALTNINATTDAWDFYEFCLQRKIKPIIGAEIRNGDNVCCILLAKNLQGLGGVNRFLSMYLQSGEPFPERPQTKDRGWLGPHVWIIYPYGKQEPQDLDEQELIGVKPSEANRLFGKSVQAYPDKFVVRHPVTFQDKTYYALHRLLRAIDKNILLSKQQPSDIAAPDEHFQPPAQLMMAFQAYPTLLTRTLQVIDSCHLEMDMTKDKNKCHFTGRAEDDRKLLEKLALEGFRYRYGDSATALERVHKELGIIHKLGFNAYFLITWDLIRYAQSRGFYYVGRGSGANSIVAYCLQITDVDPMELDLYFERFLNPHRTSPPDFDLDFSWKDRDEVIDYIFKRYGQEHVVLLGMFSTFQRSAAIRELGKVFGLPKAEIDQLADNPRATLKEDKYQRLILRYSELMINFPNHLSIHPGGMLISEEPIYQYTAVALPPKGFATSQIDMFIAEKIHLFKLDILSHRGLGHIKDCIQIVRENKQISIDIHHVEAFKKDPLVATRIRGADSIGCFYIESPAMRQLLQKLRCSDYLTLVAASSIIRPGVAQSGMMRQYIYRFHHPDDFKYLHPKMEDLLKETYGVMVYQEDVIKVAHYFAGLDLAEADVLRRAMSGKYRTHNQFLMIKEQFFTNCKALGYPDELSAEVWRQMESFGGYSFSKAHSASYAVESYQSLFLKTYYPMEFMVAVINNFGGFYRTEVYFHELKRTGARVLPPCINEGENYTSIQGDIVHTGFVHVQGLEAQLVETLLKERRRNGPYLHLQDFMERTPITPEQLNLLIRVGALNFTSKTKKALLWEASFLYRKTAGGKSAGKKGFTGSQALFRTEAGKFQLPALAAHLLDDAYDELELLGFPLSDVWRLVDAPLEGYLGAADLSGHVGQQLPLIGYLVTTKQARTIKGELMQFGTYLDKYGDWLDTVHFPQSLERYPIQGRGFYVLKGKVTEEFGVYSLEVQYLAKQGLKGRDGHGQKKISA
jgi:DNA-directed DNA polymerase III PolC